MSVLRPSRAGAGARAALEAGRRTCKAEGAVAIHDRYLALARRDAAPGERAFVRNVDRADPGLRRDPAFAQIAARLYAMSLPRVARRDGYAGCAFELSRSTQSASASGGRP